MSQQYLQSVDNALRIIEAFDSHGEELGVTEISNLLGVGKSTAHRLLSTLEHRGFVEQNPATGKYRLGLKIVHIGTNRLKRINVLRECHPYLVALSAKTGESCHLSLYNNGKITFIDKIPGANQATMSSMIGAQLPAYATGAGKMFLAHMAEEQLEDFFRYTPLTRMTPTTITEREVLLERLDKIRRFGFSEDQQESEEGLVCFAAPVYTYTGTIAACISLSGAASRMNNNKEELVAAVMSTAKECSLRCGWIAN